MGESETSIRPIKLDLAIIFGFLGGFQLFVTSMLNWIHMSPEHYFLELFPLSVSFGIIVLLGAILLLKDYYSYGGVIILCASIPSLILTSLFHFISGYGEDVIAGALCAMMGGIFALISARKISEPSFSLAHTEPSTRLASIAQEVKSRILRIIGFFIPFVQQIPAFGIYLGLMTAPLIIFLIALFSQFPVNFIEALERIAYDSQRSWGLIFANIITISGFILFLSSLLYLFIKRKQGIIKSGPYRFMRHPQYLGLLLMTLGLTAWSFYILSTYWGVGWLSSPETIALWFAIFAAYLVLAIIEESYLTRTFGEQYITYKMRVPFLLPLKKPTRIDIPLAIMILSLLLFGLIQL